MDVLIVGAGPVGLSVALALAEQGITARIIDKRSSGSALSRAVGILPNTMDLLATTGVADTIADEATPVRQVCLFQNGQMVADVALPETAGRFGCVYGLPQDRTESIMRAELERRGVRVEFSHELTTVDQTDAGVTARINGTAVDCDYLVGADGRHSRARRHRHRLPRL